MTDIAFVTATADDATYFDESLREAASWMHDVRGITDQLPRAYPAETGNGFQFLSDSARN